MIQQTREQLLSLKFSPLSFGTSGIRAFVVDMTDMECYINTRGFIKYLYKTNEFKTGNKIALGGDLRASTPRIMRAVHQAILDENCETVYCGFIPTPTLSYYAWKRQMPAVMVTGSHIPDDLNGIKFIKSLSEVLKSDEKDILYYVELARKEEYTKDETESLFNIDGSFKKEIDLPEKTKEEQAQNEFITRYTELFSSKILNNKKIVLYEQSAVGRDVLKKILSSLGAEVISVERSEKFIPIDTEKIPDLVTSSLKKWSTEFKPFAIVSLDGDSDRPLLADEFGTFLPGDLLGLLVSLYLKPDFVALPISSNDAALIALKKLNIEIALTKIGSPYCIAAMNEKLSQNPITKTVAWERNGGYLLGSNWNINNHTLELLPTRDAFLPLLIALIFATEENTSLSTLINTKLPHRFITANSIDNKTKDCESYTTPLGKIIINYFSPKDSAIKQLDFNLEEIETTPRIPVNQEMYKEARDIKKNLESYFNSKLGYSQIKSINYIDGVRISFVNNDVVHLRPSSNSPELRIYATTDTEERANQILANRFSILPLIITDTIKKNS